MTVIGVFDKLPPALAYLADPAMRFGRHQSVEDILAFLDRATESQMAELSAIGRRVLENNHYKAVLEFLDEYKLTDHEESACLYFLFGVMDYAGISFDAAPE